MRKQREERVECNLNCRLLGGELDASNYPLTFPYFVWAPGVLFVVCLLVFPCWVCCRCCSRCCPSYSCCCFFSPQRSKKYTNFQKNNVVIGFILLSLAIVVCAAVG